MLINGRFLTEGSPGFEGFAQHMIAALERRGELGGARVAVPRGTLPMLPLPASLPVDPAGAFHGAAWEQLDLPRLAGDGWLVNFCGTSPWRRRRQLVVVQDLAAVLAPASLSAWQRRWQLQQLRWQLASAQCVVTLSQAAARALWPLRSASQEIEVLFQPGDHLLRQPADRSVLEPLDLRGRRYVLAVDGRWPGGSSERVERLMAELALPATLLVVISDRDPSQQAHQALRAPARTRASSATSSHRRLPSAVRCTRGLPAWSMPPPMRPAQSRWPRHCAAAARWWPPAAQPCGKSVATRRCTPSPTTCPPWPASCAGCWAPPTWPASCAQPPASAPLI
jgi:hypothetical protein